MLRLPPFRYLAPRSLDQAVQMLAQEGEQAMLVAEAILKKIEDGSP